MAEEHKHGVDKEFFDRLDADMGSAVDELDAVVNHLPGQTVDTLQGPAWHRRARGIEPS